jgi:hypothetical protein
MICELINHPAFAARFTEEITHHGIQGQRWGHRRDPGPDGLVSTNDGASRNRNYSKKSSRQLSPEAARTRELSQKVRLLELESKYAELTKKQHPVAKKALSVLNKIGTDVVVSTATVAAGIGIGYLASKYGGTFGKTMDALINKKRIK